MRKLKKNWKRISLIILAGMIAVFIFIVAGFFVWTRSWKTYEFPNNQGYFRYPTGWQIKEDKNSGGGWMVDLKTDEYSVSLASYYPVIHKTADEDAHDRAQGVVDYFGGFLVMYPNVGGQKAYSAIRSDLSDDIDQYIEVANKGYVYEFQVYINSSNDILKAWRRFIANKIVQSTYFNPNAPVTDLHSPFFKD